MDAYLTAEAGLILKAAGRLSDSPQCGFLIGHRRGPRHFVESIVPAGADCPFSCAQVRILERLFEGRVAGFYIIGKGRGLRDRLLEPQACGKLLLVASPGRDAAFKAYTVEFDGKFRLSPIPLISP